MCTKRCMGNYGNQPKKCVIMRKTITKASQSNRRREMLKASCSVKPSIPSVVGVQAQEVKVDLASSTKYQKLTIDNEQVFLTCDSLRSAVDHLKLRALVEEGRDGEARNKLKELVDKGSAEAVYLGAFVSDEGGRDEVDKAHVDAIKKAAELGYPPAIYRYGVYMETGEFGDEDKVEAANLFKKAAYLGHARSEWIHGTALLYGSNGLPKDVKLGIEFIRRSAKQFFVEALETLARFHESGDFGFSVDFAKSKSYRDMKSAINVIEE